MSGRIPRRLAYAGLPLLYLLHNDYWLWDDRRTLLGLPIGLAYHVGYCLATSGVMLLLVRYAWPAHLEVERQADEGPGGGRPL